MSNTVLDVKGLNCPLPILRAKKAIKDLEAGAVLEVIATDPGSAKDFDAFCRQTGHQLLGHTAAGGVYTFEIRKVV